MKNSNEQSQGQTKKCPKCQEDIQLGAKKCKHCGADLRNWFVKHKIITGILILFVIGIIGSAMGGNKETSNNSNGTANSNTVQENKKEEPAETPEEKPAPAKDATVPAEYKSALNKATTYANTMHMSKQGVYDQLVSEYGEKFSTAAAQYAIDNMKADWNANALAKAKTYQDTMNMSPAAIHDQLTSEYGEKFTQAEADYAIQHLND
ncbi:Ltp family lipoprotein [Candidatus Oleimmundimicrobium sp.]|uniref:Ltp family lipoprotein n=1 Tax=Candidatus Oleimmundimicrobium sp. TaxID=3060597 RepID=UPI00272413A3|nr:Ltp family lipoprotein [Candidatus Oleimmundimicrobium sp.]MDO8886340.1 Ltp family lipoprotein [Candidatus Oleimmundimicrobium sp.]